MRHRLRPGLSSVWRGPGTLQLGLGARDCLVLSGITDDDAAFLDLLAVGVTDAAVRSGTVRPGPARCLRLLEHLSEAKLLLTHARTDADPLDTGAVHPRLAADAVAWSWIRGATDPVVSDGWDVVTARASRSVHVRGLGRTGWALASTLAAAGVPVTGTDPAPVTEADLTGPCGPPEAELGRAREDAFARLVPPPTSSRAPDLVVLIDHAAADTVGAHGLVSSDLPHLSVVVGEARTTVGPLVLPGRSPCLRCLDLHRAERDPAWPTVAAQLTQRGLRAGRAVDSATPWGAEETLLALSAAALAAAQVLAHLDGRTAPSLGATLDLALPDLLPSGRAWSVHPACGCTDLDGATGATLAEAGRMRE